MRKARTDLPSHFMGEAVNMSDVGKVFTDADKMGESPLIESIDGGFKYVVGIFPTFVPNKSNDSLFSILAAETKQLYRSTRNVHPKNDGHVAHAVKFIAGSSKEWLVMNAIEFLAPYVGEE